MQRRHREITAIDFTNTNPSQFPPTTELERLLSGARAYGDHQERWLERQDDRVICRLRADVMIRTAALDKQLTYALIFQ